MRIERVQKGSSRDAIGSVTLETRGIHGAGVTTDDVISTAARVIAIVKPELGGIKNIEGLGTELKIAGLPYLEILQQGQVEVQSPLVIQEVPPRGSGCKSSRVNNLRRLIEVWTKASRI